MARIRTIKPEMWASEQIGDCTRNARLLFIGLLNFCDDNGIHPNAPRRLKAEIFPHDEDVSAALVVAWLDELAIAGLVAVYSVRGDEFIIVTGWDRHQKIEKPTYRYPLPDASIGKVSESIRREVAERYANSRRIVADLSPDPRPRNGMESNGVPLPSQAEDGLYSECVHGGQAAQNLSSGGNHDF